jgi:hypothetical protein
MRRTALLLGLALTAATSSWAQSHRGDFGVDATVAPTTTVGFAYYVTDGLSLRPWLGLGYSSYGGFFANVGAQVRLEPLPAATLSPYVSASAQYSNAGDAVNAYQNAPASRPLPVLGNGGQFGVGLGLRYSLGAPISVFAEGRIVRTTYSLSTVRTGWSAIGIDDRTRAEVVLGLTYLFR